MTSLSQASTLTPCTSPAPADIPVQPDHFYNSNNVQLPPSPSSLGKTWLDPADDPLAQRGIPVFKPTVEEFQDFEGYMNKVECWGSRSGIVKVIPPKEWTDALPPVKDQLAEVKIKSPIEQVMFGDRGLFRQQNMEKRKWMSVREWVELCNKEDFRAPSIREVGLASRTAPAPSRPPVARRGKRKTETVKPDEVAPVPTVPLVKEEPVEEAHALSGDHTGQNAPTPPHSEGSPATAVAAPKAPSRKGKGKAKKEAKEEPKPKPKRVHPTREAREASLADRAARDKAFIEVFDPHSDWLPPDTKKDDYTPEFCQQLERRFWRGLGLGGKPAWYGADTQGSLFTDQTNAWNVAHLPSALSRLLPSDGEGLPGVNTPYLYFGMWRATFAWHVEDMDLFSINYIHFGAPKFWYAIPQGRAAGLEQSMRSHFPKDTSQCSQFLRHKSFLASPAVLAKDSCKPNCMVQQAGEFVITYPRGYHAGFNLGINCAESVNFALDSWMELGRKAKACECISDSVRIDVDQLLKEREDERLGIVPMEEEEEVPPSRSPKKASPEKEVVKVGDDALPPPTKAASRKRKSEPNENAPKQKKIKLKTTSSPSKSLDSELAPPRPFPKISVTLKLGPRPADQEPFPCCLCVSRDKTGLLRVRDPPSTKKDIAEIAGNPKVWMAHEFCANVVPETWVDIFLRHDGSAEKVVYGVDGIVKDRWNLKCSACTKTKPKGHGAPVQCTKGRCPKAFHVNCAREGLSQGIVFTVVQEVDKEVVLVNGHPPQYPSPHQIPYSGAINASSTSVNVAGAVQQLQPGSSSQPRIFKVVKKLDVELLCVQHNPAVAAQKKANKQDKIRNELMALPSMSRIKIRVSAGVFEVSLIRVIEETGSVEVLWDQNTKKEFKWGSVVFGNIDTLVLQRPSDIVAAPEPLTSSAPPSDIPVAAFPSVSAATGQQAYAAYPATLSSTPIDQSTTQPNSGVSLTPQLYMGGHPMQLTGSFGYGQWSAPVGAMAYGAQPVLSYPYSGYYGASNAMVAIGSQQRQSYGQLSYAQAQQHHESQPRQQTQYRNGHLDWQRGYQGPPNTSSTPSQQGSSFTDRSNPGAAQSARSPEPIAQGGVLSAGQSPYSSGPSQSTFYPVPPATSMPSSSGQNSSLQPRSGSDPTARAAIVTNDGAPSGSSQAQPATLDPAALASILQPNQIAEILRANPQLASILLAAVGQTQNTS